MCSTNRSPATTSSARSGGKIDMDETFMQQGNILVFLKNGEVARATYVIP